MYLLPESIQPRASRRLRVAEDGARREKFKYCAHEGFAHEYRGANFEGEIAGATP